LLIPVSYAHAASADLAWDPPMDGGSVVGYIVFWSITSGSYDDVDSVEVVGETSATVTELDESKDHYFIVRAYNSAGIGPASNEVVMEANSDSFQDDVTSDGTSDGTSNETSSNSTIGGGGGGCFIATAAYGSIFEPQVVILREFRDCFLLNNSIGKAFVKLYYSYSPPIAKIIADHECLRFAVRWGLLPIIGFSWAFLNLGLVSTLILIFIFSSGLAIIGGFRMKINRQG
jgi:hypothetical protein